MTLEASGVRLGRGGNGLQWQSYEEQGISLCFSKIAVCDADHEVKMKDVLWYGRFFYPSLNSAIHMEGEVGERGELLAGVFGQTED